MTIQVVVTFDDSSEKEFIMSDLDYSNFKNNIHSGRRSGSEATVQLGCGGGREFILPWSKVKFVESLKLEEEPAVSQPELPLPVNAQASNLQLVKPKSRA